jgi:hypothetical protein
MQDEFKLKLLLQSEDKHSDLVLVIAPRLAKMPLPMMYVDDPFLPFSKAIIDATKDLICAYIFDFPAFLSTGAAGAVALERAMAYARSDAVTILDGRFMEWGYAEAALAFNADAITMFHTPFAELYFRLPDLGVMFVGYGAPYPRDDLTYHPDHHIISLQDTKLRVTNEDFLYQARGEDFAEQIRAGLEKMRDGR